MIPPSLYFVCQDSTPKSVQGPDHQLALSGLLFTRSVPIVAFNLSALFWNRHNPVTPEGTFDAAIARLDHLVQLGITHVELMPVNAFPGEHGWGYDGAGLFAVQQAYGGPAGLKRFVNACHARGLAVLLDVVYNHLGPSGNYLGRYGPYFTARHHTPWGPAVNFDGPDNDEVRRFFSDNALLWLRDYHLDGLRLDAVHAIVDTSAHPFLEQLAAEVKQLAAQLDRPLVLIAESDLNDPRLLRPVSRPGLRPMERRDKPRATTMITMA